MKLTRSRIIAVEEGTGASQFFESGADAIAFLSDNNLLGGVTPKSALNYIYRTQKKSTPIRGYKGYLWYVLPRGLSPEAASQMFDIFSAISNIEMVLNLVKTCDFSVMHPDAVTTMREFETSFVGSIVDLQEDGRMSLEEVAEEDGNN